MSGASGYKELARNLLSGSGWQILGSYLAASWIGYEIVEALTTGLQLPHWFPALAVVLFVAGLPAVVALSVTRRRGKESLIVVPEGTGKPTVPSRGRGADLRRLLSWRTAFLALVGSLAVWGAFALVWVTGDIRRPVVASEPGENLAPPTTSDASIAASDAVEDSTPLIAQGAQRANVLPLVDQIITQLSEGRRRSATALLEGAAKAKPEEAVTLRNAVIHEALRAYEEQLLQRATVLLEASLNPDLGPTDSMWTVGVASLAEILLQEANEALARAWLRWAARLAPSIPLTPSDAGEQVLTAYADARRFVSETTPYSAPSSRTRAIGDPTPSDAELGHDIDWDWDLPDVAGATGGAVEVRVTNLPSVPTMAILEVGEIGVGVLTKIPAGSYVLAVEHPKFRRRFITFEVLPSVRTVLTIRS